jgi:hypothetical protein
VTTNWGDSPNPFIRALYGDYSIENFDKVKDMWCAEQSRALQDSFSEYDTHSFFIGTWNVAGREPPESDEQGIDMWLLGPSSEDPDFFVLGFQEMDLSTEAYFVYDPTKEEAWCESIEASLSKRTAKYTKVCRKFQKHSKLY